MPKKKKEVRKEPEQLPDLIPEIDGDRYTWFYVCPECRAQIMWHQQICIHCKRRFNWHG